MVCCLQALLFFLSASHQSLFTISRHISYSSPVALECSGKTLASAVVCSISCLPRAPVLLLPAALPLLSLGEKRLHTDVGTSHSTSFFTLTRHCLKKGFPPALTDSPHAVENKRLTVRPCITIILKEAKTEGKNTCREETKEEENTAEN